MNIYELYNWLNDATEVPGVIHEIASGRIDADSRCVSGDYDEVENFICCVTDLTCNSADDIDSWLNGKLSAQETAERLQELVSDFLMFQDDVEVTDKGFIQTVNRLVKNINNAKLFIEKNPEFIKNIDDTYYVYTHSNPKTNKIFYVGKGKGGRAWDRKRENEWHKYIAKIGGQYNVNIISENLTEGEALRIESELILEMSETLVNKNKPLGITF